MSIVSFFDQQPIFNGVQITARGGDGYWNASDMARAMKAFDGVSRPFSRWSRNAKTKRVLERLSERSGIPLFAEDEGVAKNGQPPKKALIDYDRASGGDAWIHPYVAVAYAMMLPEFQADISIWVVEMSRYGVVNMDVLKWSRTEYLRGLEFNRDDIAELYGRSRD